MTDTQSPAGPSRQQPHYDSDEDEELYVTSANERFQSVLLKHVDREINALTEILEDKDVMLLSANDARHALAAKLSEAQERLRRIEGVIHAKDKQLEQIDYDWKTVNAEKEWLSQRTNQAEAKNKKLEADVEKLRTDLTKERESLIAAKHLNAAYSLDVDVHSQVERRMVNEVSEAQSVVSNYAKREQQLLSQINAEKEANIALQSQLADQEDETRTAQRMLDKVVEDLTVANASKKILMQQWQQALDAMTRRDVVLQSVQDVNVQTKSELSQLQVEKSSLEQENKELGDTVAADKKALMTLERELATLGKQLREAKDEEVKAKESLDNRTKIVHRLEEDVHAAQRSTAKNAKRAEVASETLQKKVSELDKKQRQHYKKEEELAREAVEAKRAAVKAVDEMTEIYQHQTRTLNKAEQEKVQMRAREFQMTVDLQRLQAEHDLMSRAHSTLTQRYEALWDDAGHMVETLMRREHDVNLLKSKLSLSGGDKESTITAPYKQRIHDIQEKLDLAEKKFQDMSKQWFRTQQDLVRSQNELERTRHQLTTEKNKHRETETMEDKSRKDAAQLQQEKEQAVVDVGAVQVKLNRASALLARERKRTQLLETQVEEARMLREAKAKESMEEISRLKADLQHEKERKIATNITSLKTDSVNQTLQQKVDHFKSANAEKRAAALDQDKEIRRLRAELNTSRNHLSEARRAQETLVRHLESVYPRAIEARQAERARRAREARHETYESVSFRPDSHHSHSLSRGKVGGSVSQMSIGASSHMSDHFPDAPDSSQQERAVSARQNTAVTFAEDTKSEGSVRAETRGSMVSSRGGAKSREALSRDSVRLRQRYAEMAAKLQSLDHAFADATESNRIMAATVQELKREHERIQGRTLRAEALATSLEHQLRQRSPGYRISYEYTPDLVASPDLVIALNAWGGKGGPAGTASVGAPLGAKAMSQVSLTSGKSSDAGLAGVASARSLDDQLGDIRQSVTGKRTAPGIVETRPGSLHRSSVVGPKRFPPSVPNAVETAIAKQQAKEKTPTKPVSGRKMRVSLQGGRHSGSGATHQGSPRRLQPLSGT